MLTVAISDSLESTIVSQEEDCSWRADGSRWDVGATPDVCASDAANLSTVRSFLPS
jgi:hypothetical protein